jgi:hypothetical protein
VSSKSLQEAFRRSMYWKDSMEFTSSDAQRAMASGARTKTVDLARAQEVLIYMQREGYIMKISRHRYKRRGDNAIWLSRPWRRHTDNELGIV